MYRTSRSIYLIGTLISFLILLGITQVQAQAPKNSGTETSLRVKPPAPGERVTLENRHYEDTFTFKHGGTYIFDPYVWAYTKEFAERFRMPEKWIEPELKGALAIAFRMSNVGRTTCGLARKESNCWPAIECQMDIYYDSSIQLPWNYPEIIRDNVMNGISSKEYLYNAADNRGERRYVFEGDSSKPRGIMNVGSGLVHGKNSGWPSSIIYYDREYEPGVALIGYRGKGVCPKYAGPDEVSMPFSSNEDFQKYRNGQLKVQDIRIIHRIIFPRPFLERANAVYVAQNKPVDQFVDGLIQQFFEAKKAAVQAMPDRQTTTNNNANID